MIAWLLVLRVETVMLASPLELSLAVPSVLPPSLKVTFPVGAIDPAAAITLPVKVTVWPDTGLLVEALTTVVVARRPTVCVIVALLPANLAPPGE